MPAAQGALAVAISSQGLPLVPAAAIELAPARRGASMPATAQVARTAPVVGTARPSGMA